MAVLVRQVLGLFVWVISKDLMSDYLILASWFVITNEKLLTISNICVIILR